MSADPRKPMDCDMAESVKLQQPLSVKPFGAQPVSSQRKFFDPRVWREQARAHLISMPSSASVLRELRQDARY